MLTLITINETFHFFITAGFEAREIYMVKNVEV